MGRFSEQFIEQVAQATDIVDLVSGYVALKQKGREFVGLCPFHDDRNPSMYVSPSKQLFKCFVCGAGGGVYQWLMMYDKLPFPEAVEMLAERAGIPVPREKRQQAQAAPSGMRRADLLRVNTWAAKWFGQQLHKPAGKQALEYVRGRGLDDAALERFGVGYAPESFDALRTAARRAGINNDALLATGLIGEGNRGPYDRFRHRLMLPICDAQDRVIAFGGRALRSEERAKYLNSPESSLFDKSSNLYGLNWARQGIVQSGQAIVAEGYFDALIPLHMGVENVVATLGTALTDRHITLLARYAREVVLLFDADEAGSRAAQRALEMFLTQRFQVRVANVPAGKDPADYCLLEGPEAMRRVIEQAPDALSYMWSLCQQRLTDAGGNLADRRAVVDEFLRLVAESAAYGAIDEVRRSNVAQHIGHLLNIPPEELQRQMRRLARKSRARQGPAPRPGEAAAGSHPLPHDLAEQQILEVLLASPELFDIAMERVDPHEFTDNQLRPIAEVVWRKGEQGRLNLEELLASEELAEHGRLVAELATAGEARGNSEHTLVGAIEHLLYRRERQEIERASQSHDDDDALRGLTRRLRTPDPRRMPRIS